MSVVTYSISANFGGNIVNVQESQLKAQIIANVNINPTCLDVGTYGDQVNITFDHALSTNEQSALDNLINNYVAVPPPKAIPALVYSGSNVITHTINNVPYKFLGNQTNEIVISKGTQGHYSSISAAISANNQANNIFIVYPGTYVENNPITLPQGAVLKSAGTAQNTIIVAQNPNQPILILGNASSVTDITVTGAYQTGGKGMYLDCTQSGGLGQFCPIFRCFFVDCNIGIEADNKNASTTSDIIFISDCVIRTKTQPIDKAIYAHNGGAITVVTTQIMAIPPIPNVAPQGIPINYGIYCSDTGTRVSVSTVNTFYLTNGVYLDNGGYLEIVLILLNFCNIAIIVGPNSTTSQLLGDNYFIRNSTTYDLQVLATDAQIQFMADNMDHNMINNPNSVNLNLKYNSTKFGLSFQGTIGDIQFGTHMNPTSVSFGEGEFVTSGTIVLANDNLEVGNWTDNTAIANDPGPPYFNFYNSTTSGSCLYIGSDVVILGFEVQVITPSNNIILATDVIWEYWNGTSWVSFNIMKTFDTKPFYTYPNCFLSLADIFDVRFGLLSTTPFAQKTLNGYSKYWVRCRIINAIPNIPMCNYLKLHPNTQIINNDGWTEYFGDSRCIKPLTLSVFAGSNTTPGDQEIFISSNLSVKKTNNVFTNGNLVRIGWNNVLPRDIDISFPIKFGVSFVVNSNTSGNIYWTIRYGVTTTGSALYLDSNSCPTNPPGNTLVNVTTPIVADSNNEDLRQKFYLDISNVDSNPQNGNTYTFWVSLERNAVVNNGNDTFAGDVVIAAIRGEYISWNHGCHILSF